MTIRVHPGVLQWARQNRRLTIEQAAARLEWTEDRVLEIEQTDTITEQELEKLASGYRISEASLVMPAPLPIDRYPSRQIDDFRLHARVEQEPLTMGTQIKIENAFELIDLLAEVNDADVDVAPRPLLPTCDQDEDPQRVATRERGRIGIPIDAQLGWGTDKEAFLRWREVIEGQEILVQKTTLHEKSVRGFAIFKSGYGLVAVDSTDDYRARIFTLFHEYAHLLLRAGGISDQNRRVPIERWCNRFAANFLMPADEFREKYGLEFPQGGPATDYQVGRMAAAFKVSKASTAIRFEELGLAPKGFYDQLKKMWGEPSKPQRKGPKERNQIDIELGRLGTTHVSAIATAVERGIIDRLEARYALDVPIEHLPALSAAARARHEAYGPAK